MPSDFLVDDADRATPRRARHAMSRSRRGLAPALLGVAMLAAAPAAGAQTRFDWPTQPAPIEQYGSPDECLAAVRRTRAHVLWGTREDTLSALAQARASEPAEVIAVAQRCSAHIAPDRMPPRSDAMYLQLLLIANRDSDFARLVDQRLARARSTAERGALLSSAIRMLLRATPARAAAAEALAMRLDSLGPSVITERIQAYMELGALAHQLDDSTFLMRLAPRVMALASVADSADPRTILLRAMLSMGVVALTPPRPLDVLRDSGPDAYVRFARRKGLAEASRQGFTGDTAQDLVDNVLLRGAGRPAPPLAGDYWFGRRDTMPRPAPGRVTLLAFVDHRCGVQCYPGYALLQRLHRRFGDALDIVLVAQTFGYFRLRPPPSPSEEAEMMWHYFHDDLALPGVLTVSVTAMQQLPPPDGRYLPDSSANGRSYRVSPGETRQEIPLRLVGPTGKLLYVGDATLGSESDLVKVIDAVVAYQQRSRAASSSAGRSPTQ
ncbi:MAG: hypothetical protein IRY91_01800 [Gemmatimonadaceae bacterium]|nr:hypothetical protein [Gemmatimonadaceae bacterium]